MSDLARRQMESAIDQLTEERDFERSRCAHLAGVADTYAAEITWLRTARDGLAIMAETLVARLAAAEKVVEAAVEWRRYAFGGEHAHGHVRNLVAAVDAYRTHEPT